MTRPKTITDAEILAVARKVFRARGHAASTRDVALEAGISEGVLYQRFGSKDDLFFAAMVPSAPDVELLLGPERPEGDALAFVKAVLVRMSSYFADVIPLALHVMTHPSFEPATLGRAIASATRLQEGLARRLTVFESAKQIRKSTAEQTARLLVSLAHDTALTGPSRSAAQRANDLEAMATVLWNGIAPTARASGSSHK
jgi:AcrR family transcriptional regulator